jgi:hypothetical protein
MNKSKIKDFFKEQFGIDTETMPIMEPINVNEANIGVLGYNFKTKSNELTKVNFIIKKEKSKKLIIKTKLTENEIGEAHLIYDGIKFKEANTYKIDDSIYTKNGLEQIIAIKELDEDYIYDLETELHNFYSNDVLSHNSQMSHAIQTTGGCISLETLVEIESDSIKMEDLFKKAGLVPQDLEIDEFYDITDKNIKIKSFNHKKGIKEFKKIKSLIYKGIQKVYSVSLEDGTSLFEGSGNHRVFDTNKKDYIFLKDISQVEALLENGNTQKLYVKDTGIEKPIVDMEVEDNENYYSNGVLSHNTALPFYASWRGRIIKRDAIKNGDDTIGQEITVRNYKSKIGIPYRTCDMKLYFKGGFDSEEEYLQFIVDLDIVHSAGAWITAEQWGIKVNGRAKLADWLKEHPKEFEEMKVLVNKALSGNTGLDANNKDPELEVAELAAKEKGSLVEEVNNEEVENGIDDSIGVPPPDMSDLDEDE